LNSTTLDVDLKVSMTAFSRACPFLYTFFRDI